MIYWWPRIWDAGQAAGERAAASGQWWVALVAGLVLLAAGLFLAWALTQDPDDNDPSGR